MGVPAHDERDFNFAKKYNLPVRLVISPDGSKNINLEATLEDDQSLTSYKPIENEFKDDEELLDAVGSGLSNMQNIDFLGGIHGKVF